LKQGIAHPVSTDGFHLGAYRSVVDGSVQHFLLYLPPGAKGPLPLVVNVPFMTAPVRPFLESIYLADYPSLAERADLAARYGFALLWYNGRGESFGSDIEATDFLEALRTVQADHAIDSDRIYLMGACAGGREALRLAARFPDLVAAISLLAPETDPGGGGGPREGSIAVRRSVRPWLEINNPRILAANLSHIPTYMACAELDVHTPMQQCAAYSQSASRYGSLVQFDLLKGATDRYFPAGHPILKMFEFLNQKQRTRPSCATFVIPRLRYAHAFGIEVEGLQDWSRPGFVTVDFNKDDQKIVHANNTTKVEVNSSQTAGISSLREPEKGGLLQKI
jgi:hypothetical protein